MSRLNSFILTIWIISIIACSTESVRDKNIEIVIYEYDAYKYDLKERTFTVFNNSKPDQVIKFSLSSQERDEIMDSYYKLELNKMTGTTVIDDECFTAPNFPTTIAVKSRAGNQKIEIDSNCDNFFISNFRRADKVKVFLKVIDQILKSKPEIKNAPITDRVYE